MATEQSTTTDNEGWVVIVPSRGWVVIGGEDGPNGSYWSTNGSHWSNSNPQNGDPPFLFWLISNYHKLNQTVQMIQVSSKI